MTLPSVAFSVVCACLLGALFHVVVDGGGARLVLYLALSSLGFALGQLLASAQGWSFLPVGPVQLGFAVLGSLVFLLVGHWLSRIRIGTGAQGGKV
jgi:hypothetical protein